MVGVRYRPYAREVYDSRPAYLFRSGGQCRDTQARALRHALAASHIRYRTEVRVPYCAILPEARYVTASAP